MAWDPPSDADLGVGKPGKPSHARRIRDLFPALAERATGSPWVNGLGAYFQQNYIPSLIGLWTVPAGVELVEITIVGGGGCGGAGENITSPAGARPGGGGGAGSHGTAVVRVRPGDVLEVRIGAGGNPTVVHPSVNTDLDDFEIGDGAQTQVTGVDFTMFVRGGKRGADGSDGALGGAGGGAGGVTGGSGGTLGFSSPTPFQPLSADRGGRAFRSVGEAGTDGACWSGYGAASIFGGGGPRLSRETITGALPGASAVAPGAGGGGGIPGTFPSPATAALGGNGANGLFVVRY